MKISLINNKRNSILYLNTSQFRKDNGTHFLHILMLLLSIKHIQQTIMSTQKLLETVSVAGGKCDSKISGNGYIHEAVRNKRYYSLNKINNIYKG